MLKTCVSFVLFACLVSHLSLSAQSFEILECPPGDPVLQPSDTSADGSVIVGTFLDNGASGFNVFLWRRGELELLKHTGGTWRTCVSADGNVIISGTRDLWNNGEYSLQGQDQDIIMALSADGRTSVGRRPKQNSGGSQIWEPFRIVDGEYEALTGVADGQDISTHPDIEVSGDGSIIVGSMNLGDVFNSIRAAYRWENGTYTPLSPLPGQVRERISGISDDGSVIIGRSEGADFPARNYKRGLAWIDGDTEPINLGGPTDQAVLPQDVSANGSIIVGEYGLEATKPFIWTLEGGFQDFIELITTEYEIELDEGLFLQKAVAVSANGNVVVGTGWNGQNQVYWRFLFESKEPIIVNTTGDERDADPSDGVLDVDLDEDGEQVTLRAAIEYANDLPGIDRIEFDISGEGVPTIEVGLPPVGTNVMSSGADGDLFPKNTHEAIQAQLDPEVFTIVSALKATDPIEIDGTTQAGGWVELTGQTLIDAVGNDTSKAFNGIEIAGGNSVVRGLVINRFPGAGIVLRGNGNNQISGNRIGMDPTGMTALGNGSAIAIQQQNISSNSIELNSSWLYNYVYASGILVNSPNNLVSGIASEDRNLFSGHGRILNQSNPTPERESSGILVSSYIADVLVSGSAAISNHIIGN
jgi:uncharacterized membrane protein